MMLARAIAALALVAVPLGGCSGPMMVASVGADLASVTSTKKTLGDHLVSAATGRDCSAIVFSETGQYCPEKQYVDRSRLYCYRTLADVDCHHIPDPFKNGHTALASPPPDLKPEPRQPGWIERMMTAE
ncbi:hypothetical protein [Azospirillum isscasi]|uniref:Lipoprotein n=1 Tax=Azospirillum isscasi TaxID=3053926 RepID=A0ABU0WKC9_9PROT|nr:hypothetical protein [Azospirillum isscasi]MDQ2104652.1 hypothetical protein [Azospirillum isscasi]